MAKRRIEVLVSSVLLVFVHAACSFTPKQGDGSGGGPGAGAGGSTPGSGTGTGASSGSGTGGSGPPLTDGGGFLPPPPPSVDANCGQVNNPLKVVPPDVLLIQDRSGSMDNDDNDQSCRRGCGATSKWSEMTVAVTQVVTTTQATVNSGPQVLRRRLGPRSLQRVAWRNRSRSRQQRRCDHDGACTQGHRDEHADPRGRTSRDRLPDVAAGHEPEVHSPRDGRRAQLRRRLHGKRLRDHANPVEEMGSEKAVADAVAAGIKVFVVGIGNVASAVAVLNQMAINGGEAQTGAATSYYAATNQAALQTALNQIVGKVASCTLPLPGKPQDPTNVIVEDEATKTQIPRDTTHAEGWDYTDASDTAIQLYGTACSNVTNGTYSNVQILEGCPARRSGSDSNARRGRPQDGRSVPGSMDSCVGRLLPVFYGVLVLDQCVR